LKIPFISKFFQPKNAVVQSLPKIYDDDAWTSYLQGKGYAVNSVTSLKVAVVLRCVDLVAKTMASLGCHLLKDSTHGKEKATNHNLYKILRMLPNQRTTAYDFWHMYITNLMLSWGAFAKIVRDRNGFIIGLENISTSWVTQTWNSISSEFYIDISYPTGKVERLYEGQYMYTPGFRFRNDREPENILTIASDVLGLTMSLNNYAKDFFENGSNMGGFIEYPQSINAEAFSRFRDEWSKAYSGVMNQHKWALLEGGFKLTKMESNPTDAQALESRKMQIEEVCRIWGVPPHKVFLLDRMTFNNVEQINIEYVQECLNPMAERLEQTIYKDLLTSKEQNKYSVNFNVNKLLKGDTSARTAYYNSMRQNGVMNANEIRELEEMNRIPEEKGGNEYYLNGNMITMENAKLNLPKSAQQKGVEK